MKDNTIKVVIADDNVFFSETLKVSLEAVSDIHITAILNEYESLVAYCKSSFFDILILDVNFAGINTLENIHEIRPNKDDFKIIVLTTIEKQYIKTLAHNANVNAFVSKNESFKNFEYIIRDCHKNETYYKIDIKEKTTIDINGIVFTNRKVEILQFLYKYSYETEKELANRLNISFHALKSHKKELFEMTNTNKLIDLIKFGLKHGILLQ